MVDGAPGRNPAMTPQQRQMKKQAKAPQVAPAVDAQPAAPLADLPATIPGKVLVALTGLTDRRFRQLADQGYFPVPVKSMYQTSETLTGLFRYYREADQRIRNKKDAIDSEKLKRLKRENKKEEGELTETSKLAAAVQGSVTALRDLTYQKLENEMPMAVAGMDVAQSRIYGGRLAAELLERWRDVFKAWNL